MDSKAMPPPPVPTLSPPLLEPEIACLSSCLKNVTVKIGQVYNFYADTRRLGIENQASKPPQSLTAALGREIEKYDELCDSVESHLIRAIAVLRRDLLRKERIIANEASRLRESMAPPVAAPDSALTTSESHIEVSQQPSTASKSSSPAISLGRRPSAISISSLNRPALPPKLDLSPSSLRLTADEASMFSSRLASPVTLAPKSARAVGPDEFSAELMAAFASASTQEQDRAVDIDLTGMTETSDMKSGNIKSISSQSAAGDSSDKPIELDLDIDMSNMTDLFGDAPDNNVASNLQVDVDDLFSSDVTGHKSIKPENVDEKFNAKVSEENYVDLSTSPGNSSSDIFPSLPSNSETSKKTDETAIGAQSNISPEAMLAFSASSHTSEVASSKPDAANSSTGEQSFDLNSMYLPFDMNFSVEDFMELGGTAEKDNGNELKPNP